MVLWRSWKRVANVTLFVFIRDTVDSSLESVDPSLQFRGNRLFRERGRQLLLDVFGGYQEFLPLRFRQFGPVCVDPVDNLLSLGEQGCRRRLFRETQFVD